MLLEDNEDDGKIRAKKLIRSFLCRTPPKQTKTKKKVKMAGKRRMHLHLLYYDPYRAKRYTKKLPYLSRLFLLVFT